jgi:protein O-mannosyl-transferase
MSKKIKKPVDTAKNKISIPSDNKQSPFTKPSTLYYKFSVNTGLQLLLIILFPIFIYLKVVNYSFIDDDNVIIKNNLTTFSNLHNIGEAFLTDDFFRAPGISPYSFYRPFQTLSYMVDASISGANPWLYHFINLMLHVITCIALYFLLRYFNFKKVTAFFGTLFFSVHPLLAGAVSWISARGDLLIGLAGVLLFLTMGYYFKTNKIALFILHCFIFLIAVFTKETIMLFPLVFLLYYLIFLRNKKKDNRIIRFIVTWSLISALYIFIKFHIFWTIHQILSMVFRLFWQILIFFPQFLAGYLSLFPCRYFHHLIYSPL